MKYEHLEPKIISDRGTRSREKRCGLVGWLFRCAQIKVKVRHRYINSGGKSNLIALRITQTRSSAASFPSSKHIIYQTSSCGKLHVTGKQTSRPENSRRSGGALFGPEYCSPDSSINHRQSSFYQLC